MCDNTSHDLLSDTQYPCDHVNTCDDILIPSTDDAGTVKFIYFLYEMNKMDYISIHLCCESSQEKI